MDDAQFVEEATPIRNVQIGLVIELSIVEKEVVLVELVLFVDNL